MKAKTILLAAVVFAAQGCMRKTVHIETDPSDAALTITKMHGDVLVQEVPLESPTATREVKLKFDEGVTYKVDARKRQFFPGSVIINYEPKDQTNYSIHLTQYKKDVPGVTYLPAHGASGWALAGKSFPSEGYTLDTSEPSVNIIKQPIQVTATITDAEVDYPLIALSPTGDTMVFQRVEKQGEDKYLSQIWKRSTTGGAAVRLTSSQAQEYTPAFTYGGDYVIFASDNTSENATLWKAKIEGGGTLISSITSTSSLDYSPSVGQGLLAYTSVPARSIDPQIWVSRADGTQAGFLNVGTSPQVSPDEKKILCLRKGRNGHWQLWVMNPDGSNLSQLTQNSEYDITEPRWSPDGNWIAYASDESKDSDGNPNSDIWLIAADGSKKIQITRNGSFDGSPAWDRSGKVIYFRSNRGGSWNIWKCEFQPKVLDSGN